MLRTVLVADDDPRARKRTARVVHACGYSVLTASTPTEIFAAVSACPISVVLIDHRLIRHCDLRRLLLHALVVILAHRRAASVIHNLAVIPKEAVRVALPELLKSMIGSPEFRGQRV